MKQIIVAAVLGALVVGDAAAAEPMCSFLTKVAKARPEHMAHKAPVPKAMPVLQVRPERAGRADRPEKPEPKVKRWLVPRAKLAVPEPLVPAERPEKPEHKAVRPSAPQAPPALRERLVPRVRRVRPARKVLWGS